MSKKLIINADDYGRTSEVSHGIREAHLKGMVTSTTCMMNIRGAAADVAIALQETPRLGLGVHLVLTADDPILPAGQVSSITDQQGHFLRLDALIERLDELYLNEVKREWQAQIEAFIRAAKRPPTHLDSHHHSSFFSPKLFRAMLELAQEYHCAIRLPVVDKIHWEVTGLPEEQNISASIQQHIKDLVDEFKPACPDSFHADFYDENATGAELERILAGQKEGCAEIMCHPGYNDAVLQAVSSYNRQRDAERMVLSEPGIRQRAAALGISLIHFGDLTTSD